MFDWDDLDVALTDKQPDTCNLSAEEAAAADLKASGCHEHRVASLGKCTSKSRIDAELAAVLQARRRQIKDAVLPSSLTRGVQQEQLDVARDPTTTEVPRKHGFNFHESPWMWQGSTYVSGVSLASQVGIADRSACTEAEDRILPLDLAMSRRCTEENDHDSHHDHDEHDDAFLPKEAVTSKHWQRISTPVRQSAEMDSDSGGDEQLLAEWQFDLMTYMPRAKAVQIARRLEHVQGRHCKLGEKLFEAVSDIVSCKIEVAGEQHAEHAVLRNQSQKPQNSLDAIDATRASQSLLRRDDAVVNVGCSQSRQTNFNDLDLQSGEAAETNQREETASPRCLPVVQVYSEQNQQQAIEQGYLAELSSLRMEVEEHAQRHHKIELQARLKEGKLGVRMQEMGASEHELVQRLKVAEEEATCMTESLTAELAAAGEASLWRSRDHQREIESLTQMYQSELHLMHQEASTMLEHQRIFRSSSTGCAKSSMPDQIVPAASQIEPQIQQGEARTYQDVIAFNSPFCCTLAANQAVCLQERIMAERHQLKQLHASSQCALQKQQDALETERELRHEVAATRLQHADIVEKAQEAVLEEARAARLLLEDNATQDLQHRSALMAIQSEREELTAAHTSHRIAVAQKLRVLEELCKQTWGQCST